MDEFSDVPDDVRQSQLVEPTEDGKVASGMLAAFAGTVILKVLIVLILACIIACGSKKY